MTSVPELSQSLTPDARITLYELDLTPVGDTDIRRFSTSSNVGSTVGFGGEVYTVVNLKSSGFELKSQGAASRPTVKIANAGSLVSALAQEFGDLRGMKFTRIQTFRRFLDDGAEPDGTAWLTRDEYFINRRVASNRVFVEYELVSVLDQEGKVLPGRQCMRDYCSHLYRVWDPVAVDFDYTKATCPYVDALYFTRKGVSTSDPTLDDCGRKLSDCRKRFGQFGILPTRAFPGMAKL